MGQTWKVQKQNFHINDVKSNVKCGIKGPKVIQIRPYNIAHQFINKLVEWWHEFSISAAPHLTITSEQKTTNY